MFLSRCPVCEDGEEPVWIDRKCNCGKKFNCGVPPVCVTGRKGPNCQQPDCWPCRGKYIQFVVASSVSQFLGSCRYNCPTIFRRYSTRSICVQFHDLELLSYSYLITNFIFFHTYLLIISCLLIYSIFTVLFLRMFGEWRLCD